MDVGGVPCEVVSTNTTVITCWTGVPSTGSEVIANEEGSMVTFTAVDSGLRFKGELLVFINPLSTYLSCHVTSGTRGVKIERSSDSVVLLSSSQGGCLPFL